MESSRLVHSSLHSYAEGPSVAAESAEAARLQAELLKVSAQVKALESALRDSGSAPPPRKASAEQTQTNPYTCVPSPVRVCFDSHYEPGSCVVL
jgi:hypothetical protein